MLPLEEIEQLTYKTSAARCQGCQNHCMLTVSVFLGGRRHVSGNRCEKALRGESAAKPGENIFAYKRERMFAYPPLEPENAPRGEIGIPRVLNMYENYPFWATFFRGLGFRIILSPFSTRAIYELGMESIPSESECYPAKLAHGHAQWLIEPTESRPSSTPACSTNIRKCRARRTTSTARSSSRILRILRTTSKP